MLRSPWKPKSLSVLVITIILLTFTIFGGLTGLALAQGAPAPDAAPNVADPHAGLDISSAPQQAITNPHAGLNTAPQQSPADPFVGLTSGQPQQQKSVTAALQQSDDDPSKKCAGCHADILKTWNGSPHSQAYSNDKFQQSWETANRNPNCLQCHTTNFSPATGQYEAQGISCVACHGEIPADHPKTPVNLDKANTVCKDCHTVTFAEFRASLHNDKGLQCTSCHYAHENGLRLGDQVSQCTNCHKNQLDDFAHESHINAGLVCRNCHGYVDPNQEVPIDGLVPTGHDFRESTHACLECHQSIKLTANGATGSSPAASGFSVAENQQASLRGEQASLRITELEAAYKTLVLQNRNSNLVGLLEGGIAGLVIGGVAVALYYRRRRTIPKQDGAK